MIFRWCFHMKRCKIENLLFYVIFFPLIMQFSLWTFPSSSWRISCSGLFAHNSRQLHAATDSNVLRDIISALFIYLKLFFLLLKNPSRKILFLSSNRLLATVDRELSKENKNSVFTVRWVCVVPVRKLWGTCLALVSRGNNNRENLGHETGFGICVNQKIDGVNSILFEIENLGRWMLLWIFKFLSENETELKGLSWNDLN